MKRDLSNAFTPKSIHLLTHTDLDGLGCELVLAKFIKEYTCQELGYNELDAVFLNHVNNMEDDDILLVTDLCPSKKALESIGNKRVYVIDHHKTALDRCDGTNVFIFSEDETGRPISATEGFLTWMLDNSDMFGEYCVVPDSSLLENLKRYTKVISYWDTFEWRKYADISSIMGGHAFGNPRLFVVYKPNEILSIDAFKLNLLFGAIGYSATFGALSRALDSLVENKRCAATGTTSFRLGLDYEFETKIRNAEEGLKKSIESAEKDLYRFNLENYRCGFLISPENLSMVCDHILSSDDIDIMFSMTKYGVSMRSKGDLDVSEMARRLGGGGHKNAAGYQIDKAKMAQLITEGLLGN